MPKQLSFESSGISFRALEWGPQDGPLALCLHGYPDTAWTWRFLGPHLAARGWHVVAPFMRGYGPSGLAPDSCYQVGALVSDTIGAYKAFGGDSPAVLIGHDWGAITAYAAAAYSPELFSRVVTLAVPPLPIVFGSLSSPRRFAADIRTVLQQVRLSWYIIYHQLPWLPERTLPRLVPRLWARWSPDYDAAEDLRHFFSALDEPTRATAALRYYRALARPWSHSRDYAAEQARWLGVPTCPVLYMHGEQDGCISPTFAQRAPAALSSESIVKILPGAGHFVQLEVPEQVNRLVTSFIGPATTSRPLLGLDGEGAVGVAGHADPSETSLLE